MKKKSLSFLAFFLVLNLFGLSIESRANSQIELHEKIRKTIQLTQAQLKDKQIDGRSWNFYSNLGNMYISQFLIFKALLDSDSSPGSPWTFQFDSFTYQKQLFNSQLPDGGWEILHDGNLNQSDLNATIYHYAALKILGLPTSDLHLEKAREFILKKGGLEKSSLFTKIILALSNNSSWDHIPQIPYLLFNEKFFVNKNQFGQWIGPHVMPLAYLKKHHVQKNLGPRYDLSELWRVKPQFKSPVATAPDKNDQELVLKLLGNQKKHGSLGGYTLSTLFTLLVFDHFENKPSSLHQHISLASAQGRKFVEDLYFRSQDGSYQGITCDGSYWDTALIAQGLADSGYPATQLQPTAEFLFSIQDKNTGGFGFGKDFEEFADTDDTAEILLFLSKIGISNKKTTQAEQWLLSMQNNDGGWGAFDKNNNGNLILKIFGAPFEDSADLFDESSADVTGHVLEALGTNNLQIDKSRQIFKAARYLFKNQVANGPNKGAWLGRWGVNYIYGTSASLIGLLKVGVPLSNKNVQSGISFLLQCQNQTDGGFGESFASYSFPQQPSCHGLSTPSQTAWALNALIEAGLGRSMAAQKAAAYLVKSFEKNHSQWIDQDSFVGTGHPRIVPMSYPSYPWAFSLMALSRYNLENFKELNQK